jgi:hypothetical protein
MLVRLVGMEGFPTPQVPVVPTKMMKATNKPMFKLSVTITSYSAL